MIWQLKLLAVVALVFAPIFCAAQLEDAFDSDIELLAEETDLNAAHARPIREAAAGYFYSHDHFPRFNSPSGAKGYLPPPRYNHHGGYGGYGGSYDSDDYDYDYEGPREIKQPHSHHHHHHHHHTGGSQRQNPPNRGFQNNANNGGPNQVLNPFIQSNNGRQPGKAPTQVFNPFLPANNGVISPTPIPFDPPIQVVATPPTTTAAPVINPTAEGDPFNIDIRFGN